jgi:hypothetical protein
MGPMYISVEPRPECFESEPGNRLTLVYDPDEGGDGARIHFISEGELVVWPSRTFYQTEILFNGVASVGRSWTFKPLDRR